jgi:hypothetical protein
VERRVYRSIVEPSVHRVARPRMRELKLEQRRRRQAAAGAAQPDAGRRETG